MERNLIYVSTRIVQLFFINILRRAELASVAIRGYLRHQRWRNQNLLMDSYVGMEHTPIPTPPLRT